MLANLKVAMIREAFTRLTSEGTEGGWARTWALLQSDRRVCWRTFGYMYCIRCCAAREGRELGLRARAPRGAPVAPPRPGVT